MTPNCSSNNWWASMPVPRAPGAFDCAIIYQSDAEIVLEVSGKQALQRFRPEAGIHRWQRVPPTEKRGRRQSSTITVAVLAAESRNAVKLRESDLDETTTKGSGPGGQHRNKTETAVVLRHKPTGLVVRIESERSQASNKASARDVLQARLQAAADQKAQSTRNGKRRKQVGNADRAEKIRTVQEQNGKVVNHQNGRRCSVKDYMKGRINLVQ